MDPFPPRSPTVGVMSMSASWNGITRGYDRDQVRSTCGREAAGSNVVGEARSASSIAPAGDRQRCSRRGRTRDRNSEAQRGHGIDRHAAAVPPVHARALRTQSTSPSSRSNSVADEVSRPSPVRSKKKRSGRLRLGNVSCSSLGRVRWVPSSRWVQMPDGPWVLPDEDSGIYTRQVEGRKRRGHPPHYTVTGPGYDTTEHPSLDEAMEAAEAERYQPFVTQVNPGWPPMPEIISAWPLELFVKESVWPYWLGSSTEIAGFARRAEEWMNWHFHRFEKLPRCLVRPARHPPPTGVHHLQLHGRRSGRSAWRVVA